MFKFFRRHEVSDDGVDLRRPPPPMTPIEIGFSLRSARERGRLSLEDVRERTDVPMVDLDALEKGRLDLFHVEQAAIVGLWRYAEAVGLEPDGLVDVVHRSWPNPSLSIDALGPNAVLDATPVAQLAVATSLLAPITKPRSLARGSDELGLSKAMLQTLSTASLGASRAVASIGPARPAPAPARKKLESGNKQKLKPSSNKGPASKAKSSATKAKKAASGPKSAAQKPAIAAAPPLSPARVAPALVATFPEAFSSQTPKIEAPSPEGVLHQFPTPSPAAFARMPAGPPTPSVESEPLVQAERDEQPEQTAQSGEPDTIMVPVVSVDEFIGVNEPPEQLVARPMGNWAERLSKVAAERFGVERTRRKP